MPADLPVKRSHALAALGRKCEAVARHFAIPSSVDEERTRHLGRDSDQRELFLADALNLLFDCVMESCEIEQPPTPAPVQKGETTFARPKGTPAPEPQPPHGLKRLGWEEVNSIRQLRNLTYDWDDTSGLYAVKASETTEVVKAGLSEVAKSGPLVLQAFAQYDRGEYKYYTRESVAAMVERGDRVDVEATL